jgi:hypothetical protein
MTAPSESPGKPLLLDLATAAAIITALIYFTGWIYAFRYFDHFRLGLLALEIPTEYFFVYGFWVFQRFLRWLVLGGIIIILLLAFLEPRLSTGLNQIRAERPRLLKSLQVAVVLLAFPLAWWMASFSAARYYSEQESTGFPVYPAVQVWLQKPDAKNTPVGELHDDFPSGDYRLLLENRETLFLFKPPADGKPALFPIIELPRDQVSLIRIRAHTATLQ